MFRVEMTSIAFGTVKNGCFSSLKIHVWDVVANPPYRYVIRDCPLYKQLKKCCSLIVRVTIMKRQEHPPTFYSLMCPGRGGEDGNDASWEFYTIPEGSGGLEHHETTIATFRLSEKIHS